MVENGPATKPSAEQIDEWVKTFSAYTTAQMRQIVRDGRAKLKPEGGWDKTAEQLKTAAQPSHTNDARRAVSLW